MSTQTPWGKSDSSTKVGPGITFYTTPGHGGYKVSPTTLQLMPPHLRNEDGWYEEDCEWSKVCLAFPHLFPEKAREHAQRSYDHWCSPAAKERMRQEGYQNV